MTACMQGFCEREAETIQACPVQCGVYVWMVHIRMCVIVLLVVKDTMFPSVDARISNSITSFSILPDLVLQIIN